MTKHSFKQAIVALACAAALPAAATVITHDDTGGFRTSRGAGSAPVGRLTVSTATTINGFGIDVDLNGAGQLDFLIFNSSTGSLLFSSGPISFADTGAGYKFSNPFSFTFQTGIVYGLTAASSVGGLYQVDYTANTIGDFNFLTGNQNLSGSFGNSSLILGSACCDVATALVVGETSDVPEPGTLALIGLGLFGLQRMRATKRS